MLVEYVNMVMKRLPQASNFVCIYMKLMLYLYIFNVIGEIRQEVKVIWQKAPHGGLIPQLWVTPGGRNLYHWIPGVGFPISVP